MNYYTKNNRDKAQTAVALKYNAEVDIAPRVLATGQGYLAEKILEIAKQENIPIEKNEDLVEILSYLEHGSIIPIEAYAAVAKILAHIYKYEGENGK